jgi:hypothetical protein
MVGSELFRSSEVARVSSAKKHSLVPDAIFPNLLLARNDYTQAIAGRREVPHFLTHFLSEFMKVMVCFVLLRAGHSVLSGDGLLGTHQSHRFIV